MVILVFAFGLNRLGADEGAENAIRDFFISLSTRDAAALTRVLGNSITVVEAGRFNAKFGVEDAKDSKALLPSPDKTPLSNVDISSVKVQVSSTHPSVAVASFMLDVRFSERQLADLKAELKQSPPNSYLSKLIANGGLKASMFAMLARKHDGAWKIVSISVPS